MPTTGADLEYLRRQKARKQANQASGVSVLQMGGDALGGQEEQPTWLDFQNARNTAPQWGRQSQQPSAPRWVDQSVPNFFPSPEEQGTEDDGSNWFMKTLGAIDELAANFGRGFVGAFEGLIDLGATGIAAIGEAMGNDMTDVRNFISTDYASRAAEWTKNYANYTPWGLVTAFKNIGDEQYRNNFLAGLLGGPVATAVQTFRGDDLGTDYYEYGQDNLSDINIGGFKAGEFAGGIAESVGMMVPSIMMGNVVGGAGAVAKAASLGTMALGAGGKGAEEALNDGATAGQALGYGAASGATEAATEILVGPLLSKIGLGTGKVLGRFGKETIKDATKSGGKIFAKEFFKSMFEEGMEEVASGLLEPVNKSIYKGADAFKDEQGRNVYGTAEFWLSGNDSILGQFASGAVSSGVMSGVSGEGKLYRNYGADGFKIIKLQANEAEAAKAVMNEIDRNGFDGDYDKLVDAYVEARNDKLKAIEEARKSGKLTDKQLKNVAGAITNASSLREFVIAAESENARSALSEYLDRQAQTGLENNTAENASRRFKQEWVSQFDNEDVTFKIGTPNELTDPSTGRLARGVEIDGTVYVNPENIREFYQLAAHEGAGHVYLDSDPVIREKFVQSIEANEDLAKIFRSYDESIIRGYSNSDLSKTQIDLKNMQDEEISKKYNIPLETLISERVAHFLERFITDARSFSRINAFQKDASFITRLRNYIRNIKSWIKSRTDTRINAPFIEMLNEALDEIKAKKAENRAEAQEKDKHTVKQTAPAYAKTLKKGLSVSELDDLKKEFLHKIKDEGMTIESQELSEKIQHLTDTEILQIFDYLRENDALKTYDEDDFSDMGDDLFDSNGEDLFSDMLEEELDDEYRQTEEDRKRSKEFRRQEYESKSDEEKRLISFEKAYNRDYDKLVRVLNLKMSDQAKAYFKDTVLRRGNDVNKQSLEGDIIPMFHGTPDSDMYFFDSERIGENGAQRGYGFYLTSSLDFAKGYTGDEDNPGKVILAFANITNPAPDTKAKSKITKEMLGKFIKEHVDPTAESGFLSNWGDVSTTSYEKILQKYLDSAFEYNNTDWEIITQLYYDQDDLSFDDFFKFITKDFGYDGYIAWDRADGGTIAVAFNSNQIKDVSNMAPTANPDIRYAKNLENAIDSDGDELTKEQAKFFKDSKFRDEDGHLLKLYHGSDSAGFMSFNSYEEYEGKIKPIFLTDDFERAGTYTTTYNPVVTKTFASADELIDYFYGEVGQEELHLFSNKNLTFDVGEIASDEGAMKEAEKQLKVWKNILKNKELTIEERALAQRRIADFENIVENKSGYFLQEYDAQNDENYYYIYPTENEFIREALSMIQREQNFEANTNIDDSSESDDSEEKTNNIYSVYAKASNPLIVNCRGNNFNWILFEGNRMKTDDIALEAYKRGYDGVIFRNVMDNGPRDMFNDLGLADIYVVFKSNQVKAVDNLKPTTDTDIRYAKNLKGVTSEPTDPDYKVPSRYIYDSANARNERYTTYEAVEDLMRSSAIDILVLTESIADETDYRNARVKYNNKSRVQAVDEIWRLLNKTDGTSANDVKKAIAKLFSKVSIQYSNGKYVDFDKVLTENPSVKDAIERSVLDHMNALLKVGVDSKKTRNEKLVSALLDTISDIKAQFKALAKEMRAKMDAVRKLQKTIDRNKDITKTSLDVTMDNDSLRMGAKIIDGFKKMPYRKGSGFSIKPNGNNGLKAHLADILENYTADKMKDGAFEYSDELRAQIQELYDSLPEPETKVWKLKDGTTEEHIYYATLNAEQTALANSIIKNVKGIFDASVKAVRQTSAPLAITGIKAVEFANAHPKVTLLTSNAYINEFASSWASVEGVLGGSVLSDEMTIGMNKAQWEANKFSYEQREVLAKKVKELGLKRTLGNKYRFKGEKITRSVLIDAYASLTSKTNFDSLNKNGMSTRLKNKKMLDLFASGEAQSFLDRLEKELSKEEKAFAAWLRTDFYGGEVMRNHYIDTQKAKGISDIVQLEDYYGFSVYNPEMRDVEFMVKAPRSWGVDKDREKHNHRFLAGDAISRALGYVSQLGIEQYVRPQYKKVNSALNYKTSGGVSVAEMLDRNHKSVFEHITKMLGTYMGVDPSGKGGKLSSFASSFFRGYSTSLLALNPGTPFRQTISALYSIFGVKGVARSVWNSFAMSDAMRAEYKDLVKDMGELALRGNDGPTIFNESGARAVLEATRTAGEVLMKPIKWMDRATISLLAKGAMQLATEMGHEVGSDEHIAFSKDMIRIMLETQIGRLPTDVSMASAGYGKTDMIGRILTFMGGPARAALATVSNKAKIAQIVQEKGLTKEGIKQSRENAEKRIATLSEQIKATEESLKTAVDEEAKTIQEQLVSLQSDIMQAYADKLQADNDARVLARFIAMGGKKWPLDVAFLMLIAALFNAAINQFSARLRGKADWKWTEEDTRTLISDSAMYYTFGWLPVVNSVTNAVKGYDTSYPAGAMLSMVSNIISDGVGLIKGEKDYKPLLRDGIEAISAFTGLPFKNAYNLIYGAVNGASKEAGEVLHDVFYSHQDASVSDILKAAEANDGKEVARLVSKLFAERVGTLSDPVQKEIVTLYENGQQVSAPTIAKTYTNAQGEEVTLTWTQQQSIKNQYSKANLAASKVIALPFYKQLTYAQRANILRTIYSSYKAGALYNVLGSKYGGSVSKTAMLAKLGSVNVSTIIGMVAYIRSLEATGSKSKKELAVEAVNKLRLTKAEKMLILFTAGYSVDTKIVMQALRQKGLSQKEAQEFVNGKGEKQGEN